MGRFDDLRRAVDEMKDSPGKMTPFERKLIGEAPVSLPNGYLSFSQVSTYRGCGEEYRRRYVDRERTPPSLALVLGQVVHEVLQEVNEYRMKKNRNMAARTVGSRFKGLWGKARQEVNEEYDDEQVVTRVTAALADYMDKIAPAVVPQEVEKLAAVMVGPVPVVGFIDLVGTLDGVPVLVDYKTTSRARTEKDVTQSVQVGLYSLVKWNVIREGKVGFCSIVRSSRPKAQMSLVSPSPGSIGVARMQVLDVARSISRAEFGLCDPGHWKCSSEYCGFYDSCRGQVIAQWEEAMK